MAVSGANYGSFFLSSLRIGRIRRIRQILLRVTSHRTHRNIILVDNVITIRMAGEAFLWFLWFLCENNLLCEQHSLSAGLINLRFLRKSYGGGTKTEPSLCRCKGGVVVMNCCKKGAYLNKMWFSARFYLFLFGDLENLLYFCADFRTNWKQRCVRKRTSQVSTSTLF